MRIEIGLMIVITSFFMVLSGCSEQKTTSPPAAANITAATTASTDLYKQKLLAQVDGFNAYMNEHNPYNTPYEDILKQAETNANSLSALATEMQTSNPSSSNAEMLSLLNLANDGATQAKSLVDGLKNSSSFAISGVDVSPSLAAWGAYADKVYAYADAAATATSAGDTSTSGSATSTASDPGATSTAGKPNPTTTSTSPKPGDKPPLPGRGHHYGWWKNPEWSQDPAARERYRKEHGTKPGTNFETDMKPGDKHGKKDEYKPDDKQTGKDSDSGKGNPDDRKGKGKGNR